MIPQNKTQPGLDNELSLTELEVHIRGETVKYLLDLNAPCQRLVFDWCQDGFLYEFSAVLALDGTLLPGDTFLDIGAHIGFFTLIAARMVGPTGRVVAFEPNPINFEFLQRNAAVNGLSNVTLINAAVGEKEGSATLYENSDNDGGHALWAASLPPAGGQDRGQTKACAVALTTLDAVAERLGLARIKAVKIDAEGAEARVIQGGRRLLADPAISLVICEHNRFALQAMGASAADLLRFFYLNGYEGYISSNSVDYADITVDSEFRPSERWLEAHRERAENIFFVRKESFVWPSALHVATRDSA